MHLSRFPRLHGASISLRPDGSDMDAEMDRLAQRSLDFVGLPPQLVPRDRVVANNDYIGEGYGLPTDSMVEAVEMMAQLEGILLDPVYTGKGFAGLIGQVRKGNFKKVKTSCSCIPAAAFRCLPTRKPSTSLDRLNVIPAQAGIL